LPDPQNIDRCDSAGNPQKRTIRARNSRKAKILRIFPPQSENQIQQGIVDWLNAVLLPTHRVFAVPNASRRTAGGKSANAVPGLRKGVLDLMILGPDGRAFSIEVKRPGGELSSEQEEWIGWLWSKNCPAAVVTTIEEVRNALIAWHIPTREARR
jgi:hypothetical protein